ncbi:MAG: histidine kinase dimerization/phospho-acceptor domain-containing protein, partial [Paracoccaceae bacterium]
MGFEIDPKSVALFAGATVIVAILLGATLGRNMGRDRAIPWLQAANLSCLVAVCAMPARPAISFETVSLLVAAGAFAGVSFSFAAMLVAVGRRPPLRELAAVGLASVAAQAVLARFVEAAAPVMMTSSAVNSVVTLYMAVVVWRLMRPHGHNMALLLTAPFGAFFIGSVARLLSLVALPEPDAAFAITVLTIAILAWSSIVFELGAVTLFERQERGALRFALDRAEAASAAKSRFLSGVSHELRAPLNAVVGLAELMRSEALGPLSGGYLSFAKGVHDNGLRMQELVSDLLDIAAVGVEEIRLEERRVDLDGLLRELE